MKIYEVNKEDFYKGYSLKELVLYRKRLNLIEKELNAFNLEAALNLMMDKPYVDLPEFNFYRINILIRLGNPDLALDVAENPKFKDFNPIQIQRDALLELKRKREAEEEEKKIIEDKKKQEQERVIANKNNSEQEKIKKETSNVKNKINKKVPPKDVSASNSMSQEKTLMTKLYVGVLTLNEIETSTLAPYKKTLFTICYYDKYNHAAGLKYIKSIKDSFTKTSQKKLINILKGRLENKRNNYFDIAFYKTFLSGVDFEYASSLEQARNEFLMKQKIDEEHQIQLREETKKVTQEIVKVETETVDKIEPCINESTIPIEKEVNRSDKEISKTPSEIVASNVIAEKHKKNNKIKEKAMETKALRIKDVFPDEVEIIGAYVYAEANRLKTALALKALDIFESLIDCDINREGAIATFELFVESFSRDKRIGVSYRPERFDLVYKKRR